MDGVAWGADRGRRGVGARAGASLKAGPGEFGWVHCVGVIANYDGDGIVMGSG